MNNKINKSSNVLFNTKIEYLSGTSQLNRKYNHMELSSKWKNKKKK